MINFFTGKKITSVEPPIRRRAMDVLQFRKFMICESMAVYRSTAPDPKGVRHILERTPDPAELGAAIRDGLQRSRFYLDYADVVSIIDDWFSHTYEAYDQNLMELASVKTIARLYRDSKAVNIDDRQGQINFTALPERRERHFFNAGPAPSR